MLQDKFVGGIRMEEKQVADLSKTIRKVPAKLIALGVAGLFIIAVLVALMGGYIYVGLKEPRQKVQLTYQVCGDSIVQKHNSFYFPLNKENRVAMDTMVKEITSSLGYADDPTCQAILFSAASENDDTDGMQKSLSALERLNSKGKVVDDSLQNTYSTDVMRTSLKETIDEKKEQ
jgi:hypothetical protein